MAQVAVLHRIPKFNKAVTLTARETISNRLKSHRPFIEERFAPRLAVR